MRLSYQWLAEVVDLQHIAPEDLADRLTNAGIAVDAVERRAPTIEGVVVGEVVECHRHPNADRLNVCQVNVGTDTLLTIVCGAPNVAKGQKVPTAMVGAVLPGGIIRKAKLRGIESQGMLCSAEEIGLEAKWLPKEQTTGLYLLPDDVPIGADVVSLLHLDDTILELDLTPNRADCMSLRGLAYEVAAILECPLRFKEDGIELGQSTTSPVCIEIKTPQCSRYDAQVMEVKSAGTSPLWMQMRLLAMGVRPISLIVDVTNYVMLEWGQPLHAFDFDEVRQKTIVVRQGRNGERLTTLDGEHRELTEDTIVIADLERAIGIAGVMGGQNSEITESTKTIVIESAAFDAASVRRTGQRLGLRSEAQQRFEKGIDSKAIRGAVLRAAQLLETLGSAVHLGGVVTAVGPREAKHEEENSGVEGIAFRPEHCNQLLGTEITQSEMKDIFARLGFQIESGQTGDWRVRVPSRRPDIGIEADLVEEIGRLHGLDEIPSTLMDGIATVGVRSPWQKLRQHTREVLIGMGLNEVFPYTFSHPNAVDALRLDASSHYRNMIPLLRPISEERTVLRTHMLPELANVARYNLAHSVAGGQVFELGRVFWPKSLPLTEQPQEQTQLALLWFGQQEARLRVQARSYDFFDAKGVIEGWLESLGLLSETEFTRETIPWLHPGRSAVVSVSGQMVGSVGELHPETAEAFDVGTAIYAEFNLELVSELIEKEWKVVKLPRFPSSRRDLAVVVEDTVEAAKLLKSATAAVAAVLADSLENADVFDVYTGEHVPKGKKSVAIALTFRAQDRTLTDDEVDAAVRHVLTVWNTEYQAELRG